MWWVGRWESQRRILREVMYPVDLGEGVLPIITRAMVRVFARREWCRGRVSLCKSVVYCGCVGA